MGLSYFQFFILEFWEKKLKFIFCYYFLDYNSTAEIVKYANVKRRRNALLLTIARKRKVSPTQMTPNDLIFKSVHMDIDRIEMDAIYVSVDVVHHQTVSSKNKTAIRFSWNVLLDFKVRPFLSAADSRPL